MGNNFWLAKFQLLSDPNVVSNTIGNEVTFLDSPKNLVKSPNLVKSSVQQSF